jgi:hypothetical protein
MNNLIKHISIRLLRKKAAERANLRQKRVPLRECSKIGLVYILEDGQVPKAILKLQKELQKDEKSLKTLGFFRGKRLPHHCNPNEKNDFFCSLDVDIFQLPKENAVRRFLSQPFELLLNAYTEEEPAVLGISVLSAAPLRIGPYFPDFTDCFDLMLEVEPKGNLEALIEQMKIRIEHKL